MDLRAVDKKSDDMEKVKKLYKDVFQDGDKFTDYFFTKEAVLETTVILGGFIDGNIVSVMFLREKKLMCGRRKMKGMYIYGVATSPEYRGRGCMGKLMEYAIDYCSKHKCDVVYLIPVNEKIYEKFGFVTVKKGGRIKINAGNVMNDGRELMIAEAGEKILQTYNGKRFSIKKIKTGDREEIKEAAKFTMNIEQEKGAITIEKNEMYFTHRLLQAESENAGIYVVKERKSSQSEVVVAVIITGSAEDGSSCVSEIICDEKAENPMFYADMMLKEYTDVKPYVRIYPVMFYKPAIQSEVAINDEV